MLQPLDQHSADPAIAGEDSASYAAHAETALREFGSLLRLSDVTLADYEAIVLPAGRGPVVDLYQDPKLGRLLVEADTRSMVIGAVCHGPAGLLRAVGAAGDWQFSGRRMAAFTDEDEQMFGTADGAPWLLASRLRELVPSCRRTGLSAAAFRFLVRPWLPQATGSPTSTSAVAATPAWAGTATAAPTLPATWSPSCATSAARPCSSASRPAAAPLRSRPPPRPN